MNKETQECLQKIAERLWGGHASVFVGAGFSKNAQLVHGGVMPPNWDELGNLFYEKTRKHKPRKSDLAYANVLRLAEDVENMYGREELSNMIRGAINDDKLLPSDVHLRLLALPWKDVYTTNYDTLLERAASRLNEQGRRIYSVIRYDEAIGMETPPFLMKLHGDINEPQSIIISEEDYRTYPSKHQAMINHIQHAIMLETMVLIGFSGNDPNFLQWLGWVRDALKNSQRKVYLLSVDGVPDAVKKSFEKKNVIVVNLKGLAGKDATPPENVLGAINFLEGFIYQKEQERTQYRNTALIWGRTSSRDENTEQQYARWKQERETYPGWLVMPREKRENWASIEGFSLSIDKIKQLSKEDQLLYLDLFNWRIERSLFPIDNAWEQIYLSVSDQFKPFSRRCRNEIREAWINLKLGLLRLYRQEGWTSKWQALRDELNLYSAKFKDEQRCRFYYEQALAAVYQNDFFLLERVLNSWEECESDPYWDIRRGAMWAEYLSLEKGRVITKKAFKSICSNLDSASKEAERFYWASRKVHAHTVWNSMSQANFSDEQNEAFAARQTWSELKPYDDIWFEREFFDTNVRAIEDALRVKTQVASFKLGHSRTTTNLSGNSKDYRVAYAYFIYYEETGFPIHLPYLSTVKKETLGNALSVMGYCSPAIAASWMLRSGDSKLVSSFYNRRFLVRTRFEDVEALYQKYLKCSEELLAADKLDDIPSWAHAFRGVLPEVLARLCMKTSYDSRIKTLNLIEAIFQDKFSIHFEGLDNLLSSLMSTFTKTEIEGLIPRFVAMPIAKDRFDDCRLEPLFYVHNSFTLSPDSFGSVVEDLMRRIGINENEDKVLFYRLLFLYKCGVLSELQKQRLASALWADVDDKGFPRRTIFHRFAFLSFPHPSDIDPQELLKDYFRTTPIPIVGTGDSISFYGSSVPLFNNIKGTTNSDIQYTWDAALLNQLCGSLIQMWELDKHHLLGSDKPGLGFSVKEEIQKRFSEVEAIVVGVIAPRIELLNETNKQGLKRMVTEFESYGMPSIRMRFSLAKTMADVEDLKRELPERLASPDDRLLADCINAIIYLGNNGADIKAWVEIISEYFRGNAEQGRIAIIGALGIILPQKDYLGYGSIQSNLLIGLKRLYVLTQIESTDSELQANEKLYLRKLAAPIVLQLLKDNCNTDANLSEWRTYYGSPETCLDIRNSFVD